MICCHNGCSSNSNKNDSGVHAIAARARVGSWESGIVPETRGVSPQEEEGFEAIGQILC